MPFYNYDRDIPATNDSPSDDQPLMTQNANSTDSILNVDLFGFNLNNGGWHQKSTYVVQGSDPTPVSIDGNQAIVYAKTINSIAELFLTRNGSTTPVQLSSDVAGQGTGSPNSLFGQGFLPGGFQFRFGQQNITDNVSVTYASGGLSSFNQTTLGVLFVPINTNSGVGITLKPGGFDKDQFTARIAPAFSGSLFFWLAIGY